MKMTGLPRFATHCVANLLICRQEIDFRLATQCVANVTAVHQDWIFQVKLPDKLQIVYGITRPEVRFNPVRKILQQSLSIPSPLLTLLFLFHDLSSDKPICDNLTRVD